MGVGKLPPGARADKTPVILACRSLQPSMRVVLQRVSSAAVRVGERVTGRIERGFLLLVGFTHDDREAALAWMAD